MISQRKGLDKFIKIYTIMNYERTKHRNRASQKGQQSSEASKEISIKSKGHRMYEKGVWNIQTPSVSLCTRGRRDRKDITGSRGKKSGDGQIACWVDQCHSAAEQENKNKYQWNYSRSDKALSKTGWEVRKIEDRWHLSMSMIG